MMKLTYYMSYVMILMYTLGETLRRGFEYFAINATTMFEDYVSAVLFIIAVWTWHKRSDLAPKFMLTAWAYALGGMFVPFFAHLEAFLRGVTVRPEHPHDDLGSVILKASIWGVCAVFTIITIRSDRSEYPSKQD